MAFLKDSISPAKLQSEDQIFEIINVEDDFQQDKDDSKILERYLEGLGLSNDKAFSPGDSFDDVFGKMHSIYGDNLVCKLVLRKGYGETPKEGQTVTVDYNAYAELESIPFDSTYARNQRYLHVVDGTGIDGLQIALESMKINEKSLFLLDPSVAYKDSGFERVVSNSRILFEIEVYSISGTIPKESKMFTDVKVVCMKMRKNAGNLFRAGDFRMAQQLYTKALRKLDDSRLETYDQEEEHTKLQLILHQNLLICANKLDIPKKGCWHANFIFNLAKNGMCSVPAKVYYHNALCLLQLNGYDEALRKLRQAVTLFPDNKHIKDALELVQQRWKDQRAKEKEFSSKCFKNNNC